MTTFWRPCPPYKAWGECPHPHQVIDRQLCTLWARCELCGYSGEFSDFVLYERGRESATVCDQCNANEQQVVPMVMEGWVRR
jgi:hypothetical protein